MITRKTIVTAEPSEHSIDHIILFEEETVYSQRDDETDTTTSVICAITIHEAQALATKLDVLVQEYYLAKARKAELVEHLLNMANEEETHKKAVDELTSKLASLVTNPPPSVREDQSNEDQNDDEMSPEPNHEPDDFASSLDDASEYEAL